MYNDDVESSPPSPDPEPEPSLPSEGQERDPTRPVHVEFSVDLAHGERIQVTVEAQAGSGEVTITQRKLPEEGQPAPAAAPTAGPVTEPALMPVARRPAWWQKDRLAERLRALNRLCLPFQARWLFTAALAFYLITRLVHLASYPISFPSTEAIHTVLAANLLQNGLRSTEGELLPTFFRNDGRYTLGLSVYLQVLPYLLLGKSVWMARGLTALLSLLAALWAGWLLRDLAPPRPEERLSLWWSAPLLLALTPAWFVFSRSAFEAGLGVTFYTGFLYFLIAYRQSGGQNAARLLYLALLCGGLAFYTLGSLQVALVLTGLLFLAVDWRFLLRQPRRANLVALALVALLGMPLVRFWVVHPSEYAASLGLNDPVWDASLPWLLRLTRLASNYLSAFNPLYWFFPTRIDSPLYSMLGYGPLPWLLLPFTLWGIWLAIRHFRSNPRQRLLLLALLAAPAGAALAGTALPNLLGMVVPLLLFAALGLFDLLGRLRFLVSSGRLGASGAFPYALWIILAVAGLVMFNDALVNGPTWYRQYGQNGLQYGASQVFTAANDYSTHHPDRRILVSPEWAFQPDVLRQFFSSDYPNIQLGGPGPAMVNIDPNLGDDAYFMTASEYNKLLGSNKFKKPQVEQILNTPDGQPGFYLVRLEYSPQIEQILAEERAALNRLVEEETILDGQTVKVAHSAIEGSIGNLFDGSNETLVKTTGANPLVIEITFPQARKISGVRVHVGSEAARLIVMVTTNAGQTVSQVQEAGEVKDYKDVTLQFPSALDASVLRVEWLDINAPDISNVHMWELAVLH